jgi:hypothetical protein
VNKDFQQLRRVLGGSDPFVNQGHQIVALRKRKRAVPEWVMSNVKIREVLLRAFPKLAINQRQRDRAARWARIIHLYFRLQWTSRQVAAEIGATPDSVISITRSITRVASGKRSDTCGERGVRPRNRPKKK